MKTVSTFLPSEPHALDLFSSSHGDCPNFAGTMHPSQQYEGEKGQALTLAFQSKLEHI